ncbi:hypothetical protein BpHYR1_052732 [Brachionus plicatilis]|uniref:Uncharacterized protein n=1 Tax=Brachionus plicatilis TaxID=10195 RepID=A0A3M7SK31_BRAPC|nr:hypothetical protein BpHYR1_052732 [Brachionus plicatilis]
MYLDAIGVCLVIIGFNEFNAAISFLEHAGRKFGFDEPVGDVSSSQVENGVACFYLVNVATRARRTLGKA